VRLTLAAARDLLHQAFAAHGYSAVQAHAIADHLIDCELRGLSYGGLARALSIIDRVDSSGGPHGAIAVVYDTAVSARIDGGDQVGYLVGDRATDLAIAKARTSAVAVVGANNTWYTGMLSYYLERVTAAGYVGMASSSGGALVAPSGSSQAKFGTNPIAFGFPTTGDPVIWDIGTSQLMLAQVLLAHRLGKPLPDGVAWDKDGQPTTTPLDVIGGAVAAWGEHKGSGLGLVVQMLGMLAGASAAPVGLTDCGLLLVVIDPAALGVHADYAGQVSQFADSVRCARVLDPQRPVLMPFDRSAAERRRRLADGHIEVADQVYTDLVADTGTATADQPIGGPLTAPEDAR